MEFTKEQVKAHVIAKLDRYSKSTFPVSMASQAQMEKQILETALAALTAEPVADIVSGGPGGSGRMPHAELRTYDVQPGPLYAVPQPSYSQGIEDAAKWVDQQRESYDDEHGRVDNDTGSFEFGNDAQRDYSDTLAEIAEGIRALHPNAGIPPAPIMPDSENGLMPCPFCGGKARQLTIEQDNDPHFGGDVITCTECGASSHVEFGFKENLESAWNNRAAMLNGSDE
ncbi:TPA: restriction alleviation protein, Lar family [Citrobacter werkmanii]|uniref:Restriction alleviation protein, Lar family n=1 Tax=Citrobacter werkmanii TaxID=67827 RepID=A0AA38DSJ6_9ENTR|nr:restriction alleviation protein, Lar family [Citrobacter werkmanii]